ncbi:MAG: DUF2203 family protein [Planctomycetaceae bacterium]
MVAEETVLSVDDVNRRLPLVRSIVQDIVSLHKDLSVRRDRLRSLRDRYPAAKSADSVYEQEVLQMETELSKDEVRFAELEMELEQIGGQLSNAVSGTVDFPGEFDGDRVMFCWQIGEPEVMYLHSENCAPGNRHPLFEATETNGNSGLTGQSG